ncbi:MAG: 4-(cytidine 5'-diphospho)-2-C-methyl-D-erythritol kinase [Bacillota bacterium]|nr:4-(cytidine 5'-diphospho)-2-C-methyl-D-erythritol kinase [Bacillota bacterium]
MTNNAITIQAFAKINLSLDVKGVLDNGYHIVEMVMQQISLHDNVTLTRSSGDGSLEISLTSTREDLPVDSSNLAYKAAALMAEKFPEIRGTLNIHIDKHIPVAAGMAGGSSNCAAVIHGINQLWNLNLTVAQMNELGAMLGSDVPFCIMGQAAASDNLRDNFAKDEMACHCALATGTGTDLIPLPGLKAYIALSKPSIAVSTAEVYKGIDNEIISIHPDNQALIEGLRNENMEDVHSNMINVLENYTLKVYPSVMYAKDMISTLYSNGPVLMSGSGPTVFAVCSTKEEADGICHAMLPVNKESFSVYTTR